MEPGISNAALARAAFVTAQTMRSIVANVEREGLLTRKAGLEHGRILRGELTQKGRDVLRKAHMAASEIARAMTASLSANEAECLTSLLSKCADTLAVACPRDLY